MTDSDTLTYSTEIRILDSKALLGDNRPSDVDPQTGAPQKLQQIQISADPNVSVFPNLLSDVECDHLIGLVEGYWTPSLVGNKEESQDQDSWGRAGEYDNSATDYRTSWSCFLRWCQTSVVERLEQRVADIGKLWLPVGDAQVERMNMVRYAPGERFRVHHDGNFRPITVFVYLNDLPENDEGDTYFPMLGYKFKPRKGTAIMWRNNCDDGSEDTRMIHAGQPPLSSIKYGVNCFINESVMRETVSSPLYPLENSVVQRVCDWSKDSPASGENGSPAMQTFLVVKSPNIYAISGFLTAEEIENIMREVSDTSATFQDGPFAAGEHTLHQFDFAATPTISAIEARCYPCIDDVFRGQGLTLDHLAKLRVVRPATALGLSDRGCGKCSVYINLGSADEVFFPMLGIRFVLGPGDALSIPSVNFETGLSREEMRTLRVHRPVDGEQAPIGLNCFFHDDPVRLTQNSRKFVHESDLR